MIFGNFFHSIKINKLYRNIADQYASFYQHAKENKDDYVLSYLPRVLKPTILEVNDAYLSDNLPNKTMVVLYRSIDDGLGKVINIYRVERKEKYYAILLDLILDFLKKVYLREGRKGALTVEDVKGFKSKFDAYYAVIESLTDKLSKMEVYVRELKEAQSTLSGIKKAFATNAQKEAAVSKYNAAIYFYNNYSQAIEDDKANLSALRAKDMNEDLFNPNIAFSVHDNTEYAKAIQKQRDEDHKSIDRDIKGLFGDHASEELPLLEEKDVTVEQMNKDINVILEKLDSLGKKIDDQHESTRKEIKVSRALDQSYYDKLSNKLNDLSNEIKSLNTDEFIKRIVSVFTSNIKKSETEEVPSIEEQLICETEIKNRKLSTKYLIDSSADDEVQNYIAGFAVIRALIDSWCRFDKGYELNERARVFKPKDKNGVILKTNLDVFTRVFGNYAESISRVWKECNLGVHGNFAQLGGLDKAAKSLEECETIVFDNVGLDYKNIDYVEGAKRLYKLEIESINRLVDGNYNDRELSNDKIGKMNLDERKLALINERQYALKRVIGYKKYLSDKVDSSFFDEIGEPKDFDK